jgi:ribonucleoside-triphosphate reductase
MSPKSALGGWFIPAVLTVGSGVGAFLLAAPVEFAGITQLGLYTVPSHIFVSPFPHEPVLLGIARDHGAWACALISTWGALVAALIDYRFTLPWVHKPEVRAKYVDAALYQKSARWFAKAPFLTIVVTGLTPIPFYPFKFLALASGYSRTLYMWGIFVGRTPRYWMLAYLGYVLQPPTWSLVLLAMIVFTMAYWGRTKSKSSPGPEDEEERFAAAGVDEGS